MDVLVDWCLTFNYMASLCAGTSQPFLFEHLVGFPVKGRPRLHHDQRSSILSFLRMSYGELAQIGDPHGLIIYSCDYLLYMNPSAKDCTVALSSLCRLKLWRHCFDYITLMRRSGIEPNVFSYTTVMSALKDQGQLRLSMVLWEDMRSHNVKPNQYTYTALIKCCEKQKAWHDVISVVGDMRENGMIPNASTYTAAISACGSANPLAAHSCVTLSEWMRVDGVEPDIIVYNALIAACDRATNWERIAELWDEIMAKGLSPTLITYSVMISACEKNGKWERIRDYLDQMTESGLAPNCITYTAAMSTFVRCRQYRRAIKLFDLMTSLPDFKLDLVAYNVALSACVEEGCVDDILRIYQSMRESSVSPNSLTFTLLFRCLALANSDATPSLYQLVNDLKGLDSSYRGMAYTKVMCASLTERDWEKMDRMLDNLMFYGVKVPPDMYTHLLRTAENMGWEGPSDVQSLKYFIDRLDHMTCDSMPPEESGIPAILRNIRQAHSLTSASIFVKPGIYPKMEAFLSGYSQIILGSLKGLKEWLVNLEDPKGKAFVAANLLYIACQFDHSTFIRHLLTTLSDLKFDLKSLPPELLFSLSRQTRDSHMRNSLLDQVLKEAVPEDKEKELNFQKIIIWDAKSLVELVEFCVFKKDFRQCQNVYNLVKHRESWVCQVLIKYAALCSLVSRNDWLTFYKFFPGIRPFPVEASWKSQYRGYLLVVRDLHGAKTNNEHGALLLTLVSEICTTVLLSLCKYKQKRRAKQLYHEMQAEKVPITAPFLSLYLSFLSREGESEAINFLQEELPNLLQDAKLIQVLVNWFNFFESYELSQVIRLGNLIYHFRSPRMAEFFFTSYGDKYQTEPIFLETAVNVLTILESPMVEEFTQKLAQLS